MLPSLRNWKGFSLKENLLQKATFTAMSLHIPEKEVTEDESWRHSFHVDSLIHLTGDLFILDKYWPMLPVAIVRDTAIKETGELREPTGFGVSICNKVQVKFMLENNFRATKLWTKKGFGVFSMNKDPSIIKVSISLVKSLWWRSWKLRVKRFYMDTYKLIGIVRALSLRVWKHGYGITRILIGYVLSDARFNWLVRNTSVYQENLFQSISKKKKKPALSFIPSRVFWVGVGFLFCCCSIPFAQ